MLGWNENAKQLGSGGVSIVRPTNLENLVIALGDHPMMPLVGVTPHRLCDGGGSRVVAKEVESQYRCVVD